MSKDIFDQARRIHKKLQADVIFTHANEDSRGIVIPPPTEKICALAQQFNGVSQDALLNCLAIVVATSDMGSYIRTKGTHSIEIDLRGFQGQVSPEPDYGELLNISRRRSGVRIIAFPDKPVFIEAHSHFLTTQDGIDAHEPTNALLNILPEEKTAAIARGLLQIYEEDIDRIINS